MMLIFSFFYVYLKTIKNGWELMYSTFDADAPGPLVNPYFILYNKYRGTMRIFLYLTTQFVATSSYLQDGLSVASTHQTSLLNFMGQDIIDATKVSSEYQQIQPVPTDGTAPLASNKWYMLEYDIAYDPNIESIPYDEIQLCWHLNYVDVSNIKMFGTQIGTLNGTIGAATTEKGNVIKSLKETGSTAGKALITGIGTKIVSDNTIDEKTGENKLGLRNDIFKNLAADLKNAYADGVGGLPKAALKLVKAIFGGVTGPTPISFEMRTEIEMSGKQTSAGSFPSSPTSVWIPGTNIAPDAVGYIPLYNKPLGVINFKGQPDINMTIDAYEYQEPDEPFDPDRMMTVTEYWAYYLEDLDYSDYLIVNPEVQKIADVTIEQQKLVVTGYSHWTSKEEFWWDNLDLSAKDGSTWDDYAFPSDLRFGVRFTVKVAPKDGSPASYILKTFLLKARWTVVTRYE